MASLDEVVQMATNTFYHREQRGRPRPRKGKEGRRQGMSKYWPPSSQLRVLKDKAQDKCQICRQAGHWAEQCLNHGTPPVTACHKCHQLGHWAVLCPWGLRVLGSNSKLSPVMAQQNWSSPLQPAPMSQITITGLEPRVQLAVASRSKHCLINTGLLTLHWLPLREPSPPRPVPFWVP